MSKSQKLHARSLVLTTVLGAALMLPVWAIAEPADLDAPSRCTVNTAMGALRSGSVGDLCECDVLTVGFVQYIHQREDVGDILEQVASQCTDLALAISETPVAGFFSERYIAADPRGAAPGECTESECGQEYGAYVAPKPKREPVYAYKRPQGAPGNPDGFTPYGPGVDYPEVFDWDDLPNRIRIR